MAEHTQYEAHDVLRQAAIEFQAAFKRDLDKVKTNLSLAHYRQELLRIASVNRSNVSGPSHSTTNLVEKIMREEALDRLSRINIG